MSPKTPNNLVKRLLKRGVQGIAAKSGPHRWSYRTPRLVVLMYHRILPAADKRAQIEEPGMFVTPESFSFHLGAIRQYFEIIKLSTWIERKNQGAPLPSKACAVTFDDGWADNYEFAFPILKQSSVPATIFLVSDMIGTGLTFWPQRLAQLITAVASTQPHNWSHPSLEWLRNLCGFDNGFPQEPVSNEEIARIIAWAKRLPDDEIHAGLDRAEDGLGFANTLRNPVILDQQQLLEMMASGLVEAGSHTCHHIRLNEQTPQPVLEAEIQESKTAIEKLTGAPVTTFCYPNGDYSSKALDMVRQYYAGAVTTRKGWNLVTSDVHLIRRIGIHQDVAHDETAFLARLSGWI
jgi:peptidoglycan/xylan/chitin deacetylase (PgdA/CDA1 family)